MSGEGTAVGSLPARLLRGVPILSAGVISADLSTLATELAILERAGVELVHVDVMDGVFCPMITVGPPVVAAIRTPLFKTCI